MALVRCSLTKAYPKTSADGQVFLSPEDEDQSQAYLREKQATRVALECQLLKGAFSFAAIHPPHEQRQLDPPSQEEPLSSFLTEDGCIDHSLVAASAVHELSALALDKDGLFWTDGAHLNQLHYQQAFPRPKTRASTKPDVHANSSWTHASRASAVVKMEHTLLAKKLTVDVDRVWEQLFPSIVSKSTGLRFLSPGSSSLNPDGSVQLIQIQLQATTPIVPGRTFVILRTCKKIDDLTWVVADVSVDSSLNVGYPCGCLIQGTPNGASQVTWVEHLEHEESYLDPKLYNDLCCRGFAFGAERWVACLVRSCERRSYHRPMSDFIHIQHLAGQDLWDFEKKCVMMISKRMVRDFCLNIGPLCRQPHPSSRVLPPSQAIVYLKVQKSPYRDNQRELGVFATTTFSLPHSPEFVLRILGDESRRHELDASGRIGRLTEAARYTTGDDPMNKISVQANQSFRNELLLQETSVNPSGSLVVWSLLTSEPFVQAKLGKIPQRFPLIGLSGVAISSNSDQNSDQNATTTSSSIGTGGGSFITLGIQQQVHCIKGLGPKLTEVVTKYMHDTVDRIVTVLNNPKDAGVRGSTNKRKQYG